MSATDLHDMATDIRDTLQAAEAKLDRLFNVYRDRMVDITPPDWGTDYAAVTFSGMLFGISERLHDLADSAQALIDRIDGQGGAELLDREAALEAREDERAER